MEIIEITTPFIRLDAFLKFAGLCISGGEAKIVIAEGQVMVNGQVCTARGKKLYAGDEISFADQTLTIR